MDYTKSHRKCQSTKRNQQGICSKAGERKIHICRISTALSGICLIYDDSKFVVFMFLSYFRNNIRELFNCRDNDALAILNGFAKIARMLSPLNSVFHLHELFYGVADLFVK